VRTPVTIVISDSSVLTDLAKTELVEPVLALPFEFMIPDVMLARGLLDLGRYKPDQLVQLGFKIGHLDGMESARAIAYFRRHRLQLSPNDCFAWRLAEVHRGILMTGDGDLRRIAAENGVEVHGVLWRLRSWLTMRLVAASGWSARSTSLTPIRLCDCRKV
jgi:hypothetical protein